MGIYSFSGLKNFAFIYGFGSKYEFSLKNQLINGFSIKTEDIAMPTSENEFEKLKNNKRLDFSSKTKSFVKLLVDKPRSNETYEFMEGWQKTKSIIR